MKRYQTPEEIERSYKEKMGDELGKVFYLLWQGFVWIHLKWSEFRELYTAKKSRIELLNRAAPQFFVLVHRVLWNDILLHIARLTDPPTTAGKQNLTIRVLPKLIKDEHFSKEIETLVGSALNAAQFSRDWRNRRIAHLDWSLALGKATVKPLPEATVEGIESALKAIADVLRKVHMHFMESDVSLAPLYTGGARDLLYILDAGLRAQEEERERILRGEIQDLKPRDI